MKDSAGWQNVSYPVTSMKGKEKKKQFQACYKLFMLH